MMRERGIEKTNPHFMKVIKHMEKLACQLPDMLFLDNNIFIEWFQQTHHINVSNFRVIPIGADDRFFYPIQQKEKGNSVFKVVYYGSFIPNHGIQFIIEAAKLLENEHDIVFEFIGEGPEKELALNLVKKFGLHNITFTGWVPWQNLREHLQHADVILGAFGTSMQLQLTNNNKVYEGLAMAKPVITGISKALPSILQHGINVLLCECGNAKSLADAIMRLSKDTYLQEKLGKNGRITFDRNFNVSVIGKICKKHLDTLNV
jgi:glycosyltransferase involved in cell wall biosynthesis